LATRQRWLSGYTGNSADFLAEELKRLLSTDLIPGASNADAQHQPETFEP